jgi:hypothetical protein
MVKYVQTNKDGYVTGIVEEELLIGLFGGNRSLTVSDEQAVVIGKVLKHYHSRGEGLHISDVRLEQTREG